MIFPEMAAAARDAGRRAPSPTGPRGLVVELESGTVGWGHRVSLDGDLFGRLRWAAGDRPRSMGRRMLSFCTFALKRLSLLSQNVPSDDLPMFEVKQAEPSTLFKQAWSAAGTHIQRRAGGGLNWLRADLNPPMAEHLSFRMGNQIFFVFVEAAEQNLKFGGDLFLKAAKAANAVPCLMTMRQRLSSWEPESAGWGLTHAENGLSVVPPALVTDELIVMTNWELHDLAIQVVSRYLDEHGNQVFSKQPSMAIDPSIWFKDVSGPHFVVLRETRYPSTDAPRPATIAQIKESCAQLSTSGFFASVAVADATDLNLPLYRGHGMHVRFTRLVEL